jgi:protein-disulfide isomerase
MSTTSRQRAVDKNEARRRRAAAAMAEQKAAERRRRARNVALGAGLAVVLLVILGIAVQASRTGSSEQGATPPTATADGAFVVGEGAAPVTVQVFSDFLCPACKAFEQQSGPVLDALVDDDTVRLEYHPISILDRASSTQYSTRSASASACAAEAGALRPYSEALFAQQPGEGGAGLPDSRLVEIGRDVGIDDAGFAECVEDGRYRGWVTRSTESASRSGITSTPTVLVDGERLASWDPASLRAAVEAAAGEG